ncbi:MAG: Na/Pi cotransporter family protein [Pararhodobacter sp.]|nr:Na/Pi cotransporter family protein [Pararhodobacter sp.]
MATEIFVLLGGIGLFLYGMQALTGELKIMVTDSARGAIRRYAGRPVPGMAVGAGLTALIQSSTATILMTLGFVGAGILTFTQSLGIILGANVGTTFTGWMVMLFGVKIDLGLISFPVLFVAGLVRIMSSGALSRVAGVVSGLALIFIGIDLMKDGMGVFDGMLSPETLPADTLWGRLQLLGLGVLVTVITQSSSAGVAATIVLLAEGHLTFTQAAPLAIGATVGTTFTGLLASIGGTTGMRRTALANLVFNLTKGIIALLLLDLIARVLTAGGQLYDPTVALVVFHTGFTLIGALMFLPFIGAFGRLIESLVPERKQAIERELDPHFLSDPSAALDIALSVLRRHVAELSGLLGTALRPGARSPATTPPAAADLQTISAELDAVGSFVSKINLPEGDPRRLERLGDLMSLIDHMRRLLQRASQSGRITVAAYEPALRREAIYFGTILQRIAAQEATFAPGEPDAATRHHAALRGLHARLARSAERLRRREERLRRRVLATRAAPPRLFAITDSMRWLRRSTAHVERVLFHLIAAENQAFAPAPAPSEADEPTPAPQADSAAA